MTWRRYSEGRCLNIKSRICFLFLNPTFSRSARNNFSRGTKIGFSECLYCMELHVPCYNFCLRNWTAFRLLYFAAYELLVVLEGRVDIPSLEEASHSDGITLIFINKSAVCVAMTFTGNLSIYSFSYFKAVYGYYEIRISLATTMKPRSQRKHSKDTDRLFLNDCHLAYVRVQSTVRIALRTDSQAKGRLQTADLNCRILSQTSLTHTRTAYPFFALIKSTNWTLLCYSYYKLSKKINTLDDRKKEN
jgi:hypothetical protein